jgi:two-component system, NtrC family, nitrogen regulation response regulator NtrX
MKSIVYLNCPASERPETERSLAAASVAVVWADNVAYALHALQQHDMAVLLDLSRGATALQHARDLKSHRAATLMFAVVDTRHPEFTTEAVLAGVADVFARPLGGRRVASAIERELESSLDAKDHGARADAGGAQRRPVSEALYCHSPAMQDVSALIARASTMKAGVMILGEEGTGRQIVARSIHAAYLPAPPVQSAPFIVADCSTVGEAELFGTMERPPNASGPGIERVSRKSLLFAARGGTLYFQHVADIPTRVQRRLARVLRDREAVLADAGETIALDVRPMASADAGIDASVQEGRVRDDLFRRLAVIRIDMPSLRHRREDIPALTNYFVRDICAAHRVAPKTLSRAALSLIGALPWRGNAIELRTLLESAIDGMTAGGVDRAAGKGIAIEDVLAHVRLDGGSVVFANGGTLRQARTRFEREYITAVLEQNRGRIVDAAKSLGIQRTNLYRKIRSLRVNRGR